MPADSLKTIAIRACWRNVHTITDVGDIPYEIVRPILRKIKSPAQLEELEKNSPHIADSDAELWKAFMKNDIPNWDSPEKLITPSNPRSWGKAYRKMLRREQKIKEEQEKALAEVLGGMKKEADEKKAVFVQKVVPEKKRTATFVDGQRNSSASGWGAPRTPALRNAKTGKDVISALRAKSRQTAAETRQGPVTSRTVMSTAKTPAQNAKDQIGKAPAWMVEEFTKNRPRPAPAQPLLAAPNRNRVFASSKAPTVQDRVLQRAESEARVKASAQDRPRPAAASPPATSVPGGAGMADREARLRALTASLPRSAAASPPPATSQAANVDQSRTTQAASKLAVETSPPARRPSPMGEMIRKRPAPTSSPLMPLKRKKV